MAVLELNFDEMQTLMFHTTESSHFSKVELDVNVAPFNQGSSCRDEPFPATGWPLSGSSVVLVAKGVMEVGGAGAEQAGNQQL